MRLLILFGLIMITNFSLAQCDTTEALTQQEAAVKDYIKNLKGKNLVGQPIGDVMKNDSINDYCHLSYIEKIVGVLAGIDLHYRGYIKLRLYTSRKDCGKFVGKSSDWQLEEIKKCKISRADVLDLSDLK